MFRKIALLIFAMSIAGIGFTQTDTPYSYLRVYFESAHAANKDFLKLNVEPGNTDAAELYSLKPVKIKDSDTEDPVYYTNPKPSKDDSAIFRKENNAFRTVTEGLNFLSKKGWQLFVVENHVQTSGTYAHLDGNTVSLPDIGSTPIYIFRKRMAIL